MSESFDVPAGCMLPFAPLTLILTPKYTAKTKIELSFLLTEQKQHELN